MASPKFGFVGSTISPQATSGPRPAHCGACGLWVPYPQTGKGWKWSTSPGPAGGSLCSQRARPNCGWAEIDDLAAGDHIPHAGTFRRMGHMRPEAADRKVVIVDRHRRRGLWSRTRVPDGRGNRRSPHPTRYADGLLSHARTPQGGTAPRTYDGPKSGRRQTSSFARRPRAQTGGNLRRGDRDEPSPGAAQSCEDCCQSL